MTNYTEQIQRIKVKLLEAKQADKQFKVFGASLHKYAINEPLTFLKLKVFEVNYSVQIPACYKAFLLDIGNGGIGWENSVAGPFYGIFPFGENLEELPFENKKKYLGKECILYPKMTTEVWKSLTENVTLNEDISDDDYEEALGKLWAGILPIGTQGCLYFHGIVLNGPYKGRVVNLNMDEIQKPQFAHEANFLDWYERWLDEVISGELLKDTPSWFGYCKGGSEEILLDALLESKSTDDKTDNLDALLNKPKLKEQSLNQIENLIVTNFESKTTLIQLLCKSNYERAKPYLLELVKTDMCSVFRFVYIYAKDKSIDWVNLIKENSSRIDDAETFIYCSYILIESKIDIGPLIVPFLKHHNEQIRSQAIYTLGILTNKIDYLKCFIEGLQDESNLVLHSTLQALDSVKDKRLLIYYKEIAERFPEEQDYILVNLNHRLADYGFNHQSILLNSIKPTLNPTFNDSVKKWYEIWK